MSSRWTRRRRAGAAGAALEGADRLPLSELLRILGTDGRNGISPSEAAARLQRDGPNELPSDGGPGAPAILWNQLRSFMTLLLLGAGALSAALGELADALAIGAIVVLNVLLGFVQEYRAEQAVRALARWRAPRCRVVRGGTVYDVPAGELVVGDLLVVQAGDRVPADARLVEAFAVGAEESALTGESAPVPKAAVEWPGPQAVGPGQASHVLFAGTTVVSGTARAVVVRTGIHSELGRIAAMVSQAPRSDSPLQRSLEHLARWLVAGCLAAVGVVFAAGVLRGQPWFDMFMVAVSLAVAAIPEGLPAAVTAALALGVQRMSRRRAVVRQLSAIETLGCASIICSDKTGTLTLNEMTLCRIEAPWGVVEVSGRGFEPRGDFTAQGRPIHPSALKPLERLLVGAVLCSHGDVGHDGTRWVAVGDPTEAALVCAARKAGLDPPLLRARHPVVAEAPFDPARRRMSVAVAGSVPFVAEVFAKGAPDAILACCRRYETLCGERVLDPGVKARLGRRSEEMAAQGLRVLAVAAGRLPARAVPSPESAAERVAAALEGELTFLGLVGLVDPPRPHVAAAIERARGARVRTVMVTGDHPATARAVASAIGLVRDGDEAITGSQMEAMGDEELKDRLRRCHVFARVSPAQKQRIVRLLREEGHVVAMTGDGVNDAPALKEADIGVAMGLAGTDVARQAAALVLLDDDYATIVDAVEEGRTIYENIRRFVRYLLGCNAGEMLTMLGATLLALPVPLTALQILWVNLVTDGLPALALGMLPTARSVMRRPPRNPDEPMISRGVAEEIAQQGLLIGTGTLMVFTGSLALGAGTEEARTAAFAALVVSQLLYALRCGHGAGRKAPWPAGVLLGAVAISAAMLGAVIAWPAAQPLFGTAWPRPALWGLAAAGSVGTFLLQLAGDRLGRAALGRLVRLRLGVPSLPRSW